MPDFVYPTSAELTTIAREKEPLLTQDRLAFRIFPLRDVEEFFIIWEQRDMYGGLQQIRGLNGLPGLVTPVGAKRYQASPGVYGEKMMVDEAEMTLRRPWGFQTGIVDITDLVMERQDQLLARRITRIEQVIWALLTAGTYSVLRDNVVVLTDTFSLRTYTAAVAWATSATAAPIANLRAIKLLGRGTGANFGNPAVLYINEVTATRLLSNTNPNDLFGRRVNGVGTIANLGEVNSLLLGEGLARIEICEDGYFDESLTWIPFIADGKGVLVGSRPAGQQIGEYRMVRNVNNPNAAPGAYQKVIDKGETQVPREIEVHDGHNGGPVVYFPGSIVIVNV